MAWLEGCIGCHKTNVTLRKIEGGPRICNPCRDKLSRTKQLALGDGSGKLILKGNEVVFVPMVKSKPEAVVPEVKEAE